MKQILEVLSIVACLLLCGCASTPDLGKQVRVIENPYSEEAFAKLAESYYHDNEYWRQNSDAVCQIEIYKMEGKNAVILEQKALVSKLESATIQTTTLKNIYLFQMVRKKIETPIWWIERIEVYALPSEDPAQNPALKKENPSKKPI